MASNQSEFDKSKYNSAPMASSKTNPHAKDPMGARTGAESGKARGVEHPIPEDQALIGDTRHHLHTASLPKRKGPNFGLEGGGASDELRVDQGDGMSGAC